DWKTAGGQYSSASNAAPGGRFRSGGKKRNQAIRHPAVVKDLASTGRPVGAQELDISIRDDGARIVFNQGQQPLDIIRMQKVVVWQNYEIRARYPAEHRGDIPRPT